MFKVDACSDARFADAHDVNEPQSRGRNGRMPDALARFAGFGAEENILTLITQVVRLVSI